MSTLRKVRFLNRFDDDTLQSLLTKVTLRRIKRGETVFFAENEGAILVRGQMHLICHEDDTACPYIAAIYNPGDVFNIGIDNGWLQG